MAVTHATIYPGSVDGVLLTGFIHHLNPGFSDFIRENSHGASKDPAFSDKIKDPFYLTSKPGTREVLFYFSEEADAEVISEDEATKETLTLGEVTSLSNGYSDISLQIKVPVLEIIGDHDTVGCGGDLDCLDSRTPRKFQ